MGKGIYLKCLFITALALIVYLVIYKKERFSKQDPRAAKFREQLDSLNLKPGDTVSFDSK